MTRCDRVRRVVIVCASFVRNLAYFRAGKGQHGLRLLSDAHFQASFWRQANANFLDVAVLEWCKLFGEPKGEHDWRRILTDPKAFEADLLNRLGLRADAFEEHVKAMRHYRDKFVAHLDSDAEMRIPMLTTSQAAVELYYQHVASHEANAGDLSGLPSEPDALARGYAQCVDEADAIFAGV